MAGFAASGAPFQPGAVRNRIKVGHGDPGAINLRPARGSFGEIIPAGDLDPRRQIARGRQRVVWICAVPTVNSFSVIPAQAGIQIRRSIQGIDHNLDQRNGFPLNPAGMTINQ
jgi:hypothetical protein